MAMALMLKTTAAKAPPTAVPTMRNGMPSVVNSTVVTRCSQDGAVAPKNSAKMRKATRIQASRSFRALGEALEWHTGFRSRYRRAVRSWLHSPPHRALLLSRRFRCIGADRARGHYLGHRATMWVLHFGARR